MAVVGELSWWRPTKDREGRRGEIVALTEESSARWSRKDRAVDQ